LVGAESGIGVHLNGRLIAGEHDRLVEVAHERAVGRQAVGEDDRKTPHPPRTGVLGTGEEVLAIGRFRRVDGLLGCRRDDQTIRREALRLEEAAGAPYGPEQVAGEKRLGLRARGVENPSDVRPGPATVE
jgi:hypothetical protein